MLLGCDAAWGGTTLIESDPIAVPVRGAVYLPTNPSIFLDQYPAWGLFGGDGTLLPEAAYYRLPEHHLIGQSERLPQLPAAVPAPPGTWIYGGPVILHYGHFVATALARLWPLVRGGLPTGGRIVVHSQQPPEVWFERDYVRTILGALGLGPADFAVFYEPVRFDRILVPRPAFEEQNFVHRVFAELCGRVRAAVLGAPVAKDGPVYLSKANHKQGTSRLVNEDALQWALASHGVRIAYPETLPFADQVRLLAGASCVLGTVGSGFHTSLFCPAPKRIVGLNFGAVVNSNYLLVDRLVGNRATYVHAPGITPTVATESTFEYVAEDPAALGHALFALSPGDGP